MTGILLGLFSAHCWGCADYLINRVTARVAILHDEQGEQVVGLVALLPARAVARPPLLDAATGSQLAGLGAVGAADYLAYSQGITGAYDSIVAPLGACFSVVTVALATLPLGERPAGWC